MERGLLPHDFWPKTITVCPDCGNHQTGFALCGHQKGDDPSGQVDRSKFVKVEVAPVPSAGGPDTVERVAEAIACHGTYEDHGENPALYDHFCRSLAEHIVAAVGPVGRQVTDEERRLSAELARLSEVNEQLVADAAEQSVGRSCEVTDAMHADHPLRGLDHACDVLESRLDGSMPRGAVSVEGAAQALLTEARAVLEAALGAAESEGGDRG